MTNTMKDLRRRVQQRLYETLDGKEIDMMEGVTPRLPHMLGITSMNAIHTHHSQEGTLLDPTIEFWQNYEEEVNTPNGAKAKVESAVRLLKEDGLFSMTYPYGEEADIVYCEVEPVNERDDSDTIETSCPNCETDLSVSPSLDLTTKSGHITFSVDCAECDFSATYESVARRL